MNVPFNPGDAVAWLNLILMARKGFLWAAGKWRNHRPPKPEGGPENRKSPPGGPPVTKEVNAKG